MNDGFENYSLAGVEEKFGKEKLELAKNILQEKGYSALPLEIKEAMIPGCMIKPPEIINVGSDAFNAGFKTGGDVECVPHDIDYWENFIGKNIHKDVVLARAVTGRSKQVAAGVIDKLKAT